MEVCGFRRVDGVEPGGGPVADPGIFINFYEIYAGTTFVYFALRDIGNSTSPLGRRNFALPDAGSSPTVTVFLDTDSNTGDTDCSVAINGTIQDTDTQTVVSTATAVFTLSPGAVAAGDNFAVGFNPTSAGNSWRGIIRITGAGPT